MLSDQEIKKWEQALAAEVQALMSRRKELDSEIEQKNKKLGLLREMLILESGAPLSPKNTRPSQATSDGRPTAATVREAALNILSEAGRPLHITEIHQGFLDRGQAIPGAGTPFNILVHMLKDESVVRVARGTYALRSSLPPHAIPAAAKPRRRKRRRSKKRKG